jgi:ATP-dependent 26S proteasome regulatory subunit
MKLKEGAMRLANVCLAAAFVAMANAEDRVKKSDLPAAVQKTADAQSAGATVLGYRKDIEHRRVEYEVGDSGWTRR